MPLFILRLQWTERTRKNALRNQVTSLSCFWIWRSIFINYIYELKAAHITHRWWWDWWNCKNNGKYLLVFQFMEQGMWVSPLQMVEDTTCFGWLLYSANEYDWEELCKEIWYFVVVNVALRFREVDNGVPHKDGSTRTPRPKALHIEINKGDPTWCCHALEKLYSSLAATFPLRIKMQLVRDHKLLTNTKAKAKAMSLQANQQWFLSNMETCIT